MKGSGSIRDSDALSDGSFVEGGEGELGAGRAARKRRVLTNLEGGRRWRGISVAGSVPASVEGAEFP